jgi:uncharacterized membrane protein
MARIIAQIALLTSAVSTGLFAGLLWTFAVGVDPMAATLDGPSYTRVWQTLIGTIDRGIWPVLLLAMLGPLVSLVAMRHSYRSRVFGLTLLGFLLFAFGVMVFTVTLNVPINNYVLSWNPDAPPADWMAARDRWDMLNWIRTPISIIAFICYLIALALPLPVVAPQPNDRVRATAKPRVAS